MAWVRVSDSPEAAVVAVDQRVQRASKISARLCNKTEMLANWACNGIGSFCTMQVLG